MKKHLAVPICFVAILLTPLFVQAQTYIPANTESASALAHFVQGIEALDANRDDDARSHFDMAIRADGEFAAAHLYRAFSATSGADFVAHLDHAQALRDRATTFVQIEIDVAEAGVNNDTEKQLHLRQNLVAMFPNNPRAYVLLGDTYSALKDIAKARSKYNAAIDLDRSFPLARKSIALSLLFDEPTNLWMAERSARSYRNRAADEPDSYIVLGDALRAQNEFEEARDAYAQATDVDPSNTVAHSKRGHANTYLGDYAAAREDFRKAAEVNQTPGGKAGMQSFGVNTYLYAGNVDEALKANARVIDGLTASGAPEAEITFPVMDAYWQRAMIAMHYDMHDEAEAALKTRAQWVEKAITQVNKPQWTKNIRADAMIWDGMVAANRGNLQKARELADKNWEMLEDDTNPRRYENNHLLRGAIASAGGNHDEALEHLAQANADWVFVKYHKAVAHENAGNAEMARELYEEVANWNFNSIATALCRNEAAKKLTALQVTADD